VVSENLIRDVADGNFGALKIVKDLMYFTQWYGMMSLLKKRGIIGSVLYSKVIDEFHRDHMKFGEYLKTELHDEHIKRREAYARIVRGSDKLRW
jgi:hypothetical protein